MIPFLTIALHTASAADAYGPATWGMTMAQLRQVVPAVGECKAFSTTISTCVPLELFGKNGEVVYQFGEDGKLTRTRLEFTTVDADYVMVVLKALASKYGEPTVTKDALPVTSTWAFEGITLTYEPVSGLVVTYDRKAAAAGAAAKSAL
jgi:hypothetical protein